MSERKIFINLSIENLERTLTFFRGLGFEFNPKFSDHTTACMLLNPGAYVMLLQADRFKEFVKRRPVVSANAGTSALYALELSSRAEVDSFAAKVDALGGTAAGEPMDLGFMYQRSFHDLDGHHWEIFYMDESQFPG